MSYSQAHSTFSLRTTETERDREVERSVENSTVCYICGGRHAEELDHVFPRLLFPRGAQFADLPPRLPACHLCNNILSKDEELFQQLILSWRTLDTSQGRRLYDTKFGPNLRGKRPALRKRVLRHTQLVPVVDSLGRSTGTWPVFTPPKEAIENVLKKMVKGLHFMETGTVLPLNVEISVFYGGQDPSQFYKLVLPDVLSMATRHVVGVEDILVYFRARATDDPLASLTWFVFYRWHIFCVAVLSPDGSASPR